MKKELLLVLLPLSYRLQKRETKERRGEGEHTWRGRAPQQQQQQPLDKRFDDALESSGAPIPIFDLS